jgi:hypothetical protein
MAVVEKSVEHGGNGGTVTEQFASVLDRAVGGEQGAGAFMAAHHDL